MLEGPKELRPIAVFAALAAGMGLLLILLAAMGEDRRTMGLGLICLLAGALAFLAWALTATGELRRRARELTAERPDMGDAEFAARFFPERADRAEAVSKVRRLLAGKFEALGGSRFWPDDRLFEDLHLGELAPSELADLPGTLCRALALSYEDWPEEAEAGWRSVRDVYDTAIRAADTGSGRPPAATVR